MGLYSACDAGQVRWWGDMGNSEARSGSWLSLLLKIVLLGIVVGAILGVIAAWLNVPSLAISLVGGGFVGLIAGVMANRWHRGRVK